MKRFICFMLFSLFITLLFLVSLNIDVKDTYAADVYPFNGIIHADSLVIRAEASSSSATVTELAYGTRVIVNGVSGSFYSITFEDGRNGYALSSYVTNIDSNTLTTDASNVEKYEEYCTLLKKEGFHESYCPYLYNLHAKHPKWVFKSDFVNDTLENASKSEQWKVVLQTKNPNYWLSSTPGESDYYYVNSNVIASYMDPRNSLFEPTIFQFLDFISSRYTFNELSMSKMAGSGNLSSYLDTYELAGSTYGVNPLHLLARSKQEGANNASYNSVNGLYTTKLTKDNNGNSEPYMYKGNTLDGFYNYYNINATPGNGLGSIGNGLAYAAGYVLASTESDGSLTYLRPWDTPQKAILGGAKFISTSYVNKGQNTNYFEKFNVASYSSTSKYSHQYMTNIFAPASESKSIYNAYVSGNIIDSEFTFIIPVFDDMKDASYQPVNKSSNNLLKTLNVDGKLVVDFSSDVNEYIVTSSTNNDYVDISVDLFDSKASVSGIGKIYFNDGVARTSVVVVAENGATNAYFLTVKKATTSIDPPPEKVITVDSIISKIDVKLNDSYMYGITPGTMGSTLINTVVNNGGTAVIKDSKGNVKAGSSLATGDTITISGTKESKTYKISVRGDTNGDGTINVLDLLRCQKHILKSISLVGEQYYAADTNYDGSITVLDLLKIQKHILGSLSL